MRRATAIFEDTTMAYNRWVQGIASREHATTQVGVAQLMGRQNSPDKPPKPLHPTLDKTPEILGNAILNLTNLRQKVNLALVSNLAQDSKKKNTLLKIQKKISRNLRFLNSFIDDFNSLS